MKPKQQLSQISCEENEKEEEQREQQGQIPEVYLEKLKNEKIRILKRHQAEQSADLSLLPQINKEANQTIFKRTSVPEVYLKGYQKYLINQSVNIKANDLKVPPEVRYSEEAPELSNQLLNQQQLSQLNEKRSIKSQENSPLKISNAFSQSLKEKIKPRKTSFQPLQIEKSSVANLEKELNN